MGNKTLSIESETKDFPPQDKFFGLENFGNTCYVNSVLQALYACTSLRQQLLTYYEKHRKRPEGESLLLCMSFLFHKIAASKRRSGVHAPQKLVKKMKMLNPQFEGTQHQDAQEFLNFLLNEMADNLRKDIQHEEEEERAGKKLKMRLQDKDGNNIKLPQRLMNVGTWVQDIFEGVLTNETKCLRCENVTSREEKFLDLSLDIEPNSSITHCLRQFSSSEMLCGTDKYFCESCSCRQEASKCMKIKRLPRVLILHMKRFKFIEQMGAFKKLCYRVVFPLTLRLVNTVHDAVDAGRLYRLIAVVVHIGSGTLYGHYVALVKTNGKWFLYDDDTITMIREEDVQVCFGSIHSKEKQDGYLLFYEMDEQAPAL